MQTKKAKKRKRLAEREEVESPTVASINPLMPPWATIRAEPSHQESRPSLPPSHGVGQDMDLLMPSCEVQLCSKKVKSKPMSQNPTLSVGAEGPGILPWAEDFGMKRKKGEGLGRECSQAPRPAMGPLVPSWGK